MKRSVCFAASMVLLASFSAHAGGIVRIQCEDEDSGAEVFINGKFVGECPVDAQVPAGIAVLRARKRMADKDYEKVFEKQLRLGEGSAQRLELVMSAPQLTEEAKARREAAAAAATLKQAEAGDIAAMQKTAENYEAGRGVAKNHAAALMWRSKAESSKAQAELAAAKTGNIKAMEGMAARFENGLGVKKDPAQATLWRDKAAAASTLKAEQEEQEKRRKAAQEKAETEARLARAKADERQRRIDSVSFFQNTTSLVNGNGVNPNNVIQVLTTGVPTMIFGMMLDLTSAPTRTTELQKAKNEASLRPSTWGNPDSMIAKAARQAEEGARSTADRRDLVAAR